MKFVSAARSAQRQGLHRAGFLVLDDDLIRANVRDGIVAAIRPGEALAGGCEVALPGGGVANIVAPAVIRVGEQLALGPVPAVGQNSEAIRREFGTDPV